MTAASHHRAGLPVLPTVMLLVMLAILMSLGVWQLQRAAWKSALLTQLEANRQATVENYADAAVAISADPARWHFRPVRFACRLAGPDILRPGASPDGRAGQRVLTACTPRASVGTPEVLLDRGWVPVSGKRDIARPVDSQIAGLAQVRLVEAPSWAERLARAPDGASRPAAAPYYLQLIRAEAEQGPGAGEAYTKGQKPVPSPLQQAAIPDNHFSYALQWFGFALTLLVIYGLYVRRWRASTR